MWLSPNIKDKWRSTKIHQNEESGIEFVVPVHKRQSLLIPTTSRKFFVHLIWEEEEGYGGEVGQEAQGPRPNGPAPHQDVHQVGRTPARYLNFERGRMMMYN